MAKKSKVIISCAITGAIHTPTMSPHLPITPDEIAEQSIAAAEAGASVIHLHARDPRRPADRRSRSAATSVVLALHAVGRSAGTAALVRPPDNGCPSAPLRLASPATLPAVALGTAGMKGSAPTMPTLLLPLLVAAILDARGRERRDARLDSELAKLAEETARSTERIRRRTEAFHERFERRLKRLRATAREIRKLTDRVDR